MMIHEEKLLCAIFRDGLKKRYYVEQFDCFWSLTRAQLVALLEKAIQEGGHDLNGLRELRRAPRGVMRVHGDDYKEWCNDGSVYLIQPLDWDKEDYQTALNDLVD